MKSDIPDLPQSPYLVNGQPPEFTQAEWRAVAEDMRRWLLVDQVFRKANQVPRLQQVKVTTIVREWLDALPSGDYRDDMRRRCEIARNRRRNLICR